MWDRIHRLQIAIPPEVKDSPRGRESLDEEFERITGKECDSAAKQLTDQDFRQAMERAIAQLLKKKKRIEIAA